MIDETAAMRAWLDAHGLADAELLHHLVNQGPDGRELTDSERRLLSALLEVRRMVVPGYRPAPADRPTTQDRPGAAEPRGLFNPSSISPLERAMVEPADRHAQRSVRSAARYRIPSASVRRPAHRDWERVR